MRTWTSMLLLAAALAGCTTTAEHDADEYRKVLDERMPAAEAPPPDQPLTLERAMRIANQQQERLGLSGEDYVQALINKNRIVARFLPTLAFQPAFTIADPPANFVVTSTGGPTSGAFVERGATLQRLEAPVVGNINVFRGFGDVSDLRAAEAVIAERRELLLDLQATVMLNVSQTYYQVLRVEGEVLVLRHSLELQEARLADVEQQFANGLATSLSVSQTRAQVDATRVSLIQAEGDTRNGRHALALVIGVAAVENPLVDTVAVPAAIGAEPDWERAASAHRQDLLAAHAAVEAARYGVDAAIAQYYPSVSLNVSGFLYREHYADASRWDAILSANLPIFSAGLIEADVRTAWSLLRQAALNESAVRRQALHDVQVAYEDLETSVRRITQLEDEVQTADDAFRQARDAYQNGLAINLDVLSAQDQLLRAQLDLTAAQFDRAVFYLNLIRATGRLAHGLEP